MPSLMAVIGLNTQSFHERLQHSKTEAKESGTDIAHSLGEAMNEKLAQFASIAAVEEAIRGTVGIIIKPFARELERRDRLRRPWKYRGKL